MGRRPPRVGDRVRVVLRGEGPSSRVDHATGERIPTRWRAVIYGEVVGWEKPPGTDERLVLLAGYGRVPMSACRRVWRRWP